MTTETTSPRYRIIRNRDGRTFDAFTVDYSPLYNYQVARLINGTQRCFPAHAVAVGAVVR